MPPSAPRVWAAVARLRRTSILGGATYTLLPTDTAIIFDTSNGSTATAQMLAPSYIGQRWTFYWYNWNAVSPVAPTILMPAGLATVPFTGQSTPGSAGLVASTTISTPGASFSIVWDGTQFAQSGPVGGALIPGALNISTPGPSVNVQGIGTVLLTGTLLTDMTGGVPGQVVVITLQNAAAAVTRAGSAGTKFVLSGSQNCTAAAGFATLTVVYQPAAGGGSGAWVEIARSTANG